ncbi:MAG: tripartite tricarboxylate transporter TctB family protein [Phaeovulum sp.]|uniref:tripartite tricarboxylate transporter TctB family protein n=1 Tax=Phaeovulum sp. TaxID=2934796 RepID=UPI00272FB31F|nr:tripartite tricarboxylate transporter TctB family protein [Phaeovulum sp.]MDP2062156.1 tripartite tricarboxylate transporter TctB family protein [Phaeovulum sp.]MDP3860451.1 tripartite tricarboxylate transporter TctB family protein [Phaeovulum sp.]
MSSDRIFGLVVLGVALAYIASALQIQTSFLSDPVGPKVFPLMIGGVAVLAALVLLLTPDENPEWPKGATWLHLVIALVVLIAYAYSLRPMGFLVPTAIAAGVVSYQISPNLKTAALTGIGLSAGLFAIFKYALGLGLIALPRAMMG